MGSTPAHKQVSELLTKHRAQLESLARALLAAQTLNTADAYAAAARRRRQSPSLRRRRRRDA